MEILPLIGWGKEDYENTIFHGGQIICYKKGICLNSGNHWIGVAAFPHLPPFSSFRPSFWLQIRQYFNIKRKYWFWLSMNMKKSLHLLNMLFYEKFAERCQYIVRKQPFRVVLKKRCSENIQQIYRRTPMQKYDFNKVTLQVALLCFCNFCFIEIALLRGCSPVNLLHVFKAPFLKNTSG